MPPDLPALLPAGLLNGGLLKFLFSLDFFTSSLLRISAIRFLYDPTLVGSYSSQNCPSSRHQTRLKMPRISNTRPCHATGRDSLTNFQNLRCSLTSFQRTKHSTPISPFTCLVIHISILSCNMMSPQGFGCLPWSSLAQTLPLTVVHQVQCGELNLMLLPMTFLPLLAVHNICLIFFRHYSFFSDHKSL